jgi:DNA processing protein
MVAAMEKIDGQTLSDAERLARLRLARSENIGTVTFRQLLRRFGTAEDALRALPDLAGRGGRMRPLRICSSEAAERERDALAAAGGDFVFPGERRYPEALAILDHAPIVLSVLGDPALLDTRSIAVVGARNASASGRSFARRIAGDLVEAGLTVVSGMARGIDTAAHEGAIRSTIAAVAGGVDVVYPRENQALFEKIRENGAIVSEMPFGTQPKARHFPRRNRIISGLSMGVLVVEAALRSGSLITARIAGEQGRDVFAVPGSPLDPRCKGPNDLIRKGAKLTETVDDILSELPDAVAGIAHPLHSLPDTLDFESRTTEDGLADRILSLLGPAPVSIDDLIRESAEPPGFVRGALLELEIAGLVERRPGDFVARLFESGAADN